MNPPLSSADQQERIVVGVDLAAGRGVTALAALGLATAADSAALASLRLAHLSYPTDDDAILAEVARLAPAVVGLDAPLSLPAPVAGALRGAPAAPGASPYTRAAERDPLWSQLGVRPFPVSFLAGLTFRAIPLAARLRAQDAALQVVEVFPSAAFVLLALRAPTPRGLPRQRKTALSVRYATHNALAPFITGLAPATGDHPPLDADMLDALGAALTAAAVALEVAQCVGDPAEGCIMLPSQAACNQFSKR